MIPYKKCAVWLTDIGTEEADTSEEYFITNTPALMSWATLK